MYLWLCKEGGGIGILEEGGGIGIVCVLRVGQDLALLSAVLVYQHGCRVFPRAQRPGADVLGGAAADFDLVRGWGVEDARGAMELLVRRVVVPEVLVRQSAEPLRGRRSRRPQHGAQVRVLFFLHPASSPGHPRGTARPFPLAPPTSCILPRTPTRDCTSVPICSPNILHPPQDTHAGRTSVPKQRDTNLWQVASLALEDAGHEGIFSPRSIERSVRNVAVSDRRRAHAHAKAKEIRFDVCWDGNRIGLLGTGTGFRPVSRRLHSGP